LEIFVGNLPSDIDASDLRALFKNTLRKNVFDKVYEKLISKGNLDKTNTSFRVFQKEWRGGVLNYGHIEFRSKKIASVAIDMLDNVNFKGSDLVVREYRHRAYVNDRRDVEWRESPWRDEERRLIERRGTDEYFWGVRGTRGGADEYFWGEYKW